MKPPKLLRFGALAGTLVCALAATGCAGVGASLDAKTSVLREAGKAQVAHPALAPRRAITGFSSALRCMDTLLLDYGVNNVGLLVEEITDQTRKVNAGTRDMLITAISDMTRRSRALRVIAFGRDAGNAISFLASAQKSSAYQAVPAYDIKGSVSQFDENVVRNTQDVGVAWRPFVNIGASRDAGASVLGLDLSVLATEDMAVLPGVTSRNSVVILKQGRGADGDAAFRKFGISYSMSLTTSEGQTQALRGLVELAAIELAGKLTKVPYWKCLGGDAAANEEVRQEIGDWYAAMAATRSELIAWFQFQLRRRGFYRGPVDGKFNPAIDAAIGNYREKLGLANKARLDEAFFRAYLDADHATIAPLAEPATYSPPTAEAGGPALNAAPPTPAPPATPAAPASSASSAPAAVPVLPPASATLVVTLESAPHRLRYAPGERIALRVRTNRDAYVSCYLQDETRRIVRFYPNRFERDALLARGRTLDLPGRMGFELRMNPLRVRETIRCFATERDVLAQLPEVVVGADFEALAVTSLQAVHDAIARATGGAFGHATVQFEPQ